MRANRVLLLVAIAFLTAICLGACTSGGGGHSPKFVYTIGDADIGAFAVDPSTSKLTVVPGSPFTTGFTAFPCPDLGAANSLGKFLYVPDECNDNVAGFTIDATTGALTALAGSPFATTTGNFGVVQPVIDPTGKFLYVPEDVSPGDVVAYTIGSDGKLTLITGSPFAAGGNDESAAITPNGKFLYVTDNNDLPGPPAPSITAFSVDSTTGKLTAITGSPFVVTDTLSFVAVDRTGKFLYATVAESDKVIGFTINATTGALTQITGSPFTAGPNPQGIDVSPTRNFLFVANDGDLDTATNGNVSVYTINSSTGALTAVAGSPFTAGTNPKRLAADPSGKFLLVSNEDANTMSVFKVDQSTGVLTEVSGSPFATNVGSEGITITHR